MTDDAMNISSKPEWPVVLETWADLGNRLAAQPRPDWSPVMCMIQAAQPAIKAKADELDSLLKECSQKFAPLGEPLELDLGAHRWLDPEREEAYSDWLAWVVQNAQTARRVFRIFALEKPHHLSDDSLATVEREPRVLHGHEDHEGRLDIRISFQGRPAIIVEVKKGDADTADTDKHAGYLKSHRDVDGVLVATSASKSEYAGFKFRSWANACIELRLFAIDLCKSGKVLAAAMVLAFVAAVEQNLVGLSLVPGSVGFARSSVVDHLRDFLKEL